jgi:hypothetical protein
MQRLKFIITRIIGNELSPRDMAGTRLRTLKFILDNERLPHDISRYWLINRVLDDDLARQIKTILDAAGEAYGETQIDWQQYESAFSYADRVRILIGINQARNQCIRYGKQLSEFTVVLDGDNYFEPQAWMSLTQSIIDDQKENSLRKYYAIPIQRTVLSGREYVAAQNEKLEEPIIVFRFDSDLDFDELRAFGDDDKQELLRRLQLQRVAEGWFELGPDGPCKIVGSVKHLQTGSEGAETNVSIRMRLRRQSLNLLIARANRILERRLLSSGRLLALLLFVAKSWLQHERR